jgi:hypothetical protein
MSVLKAPPASAATVTALAATVSTQGASIATQATQISAASGAASAASTAATAASSAAAAATTAAAAAAPVVTVLSGLYRPLGGSSNDAARLNAALVAIDAAGGGTMILHSPGTFFRMEDALRVGSNTTVVLWDCKLLRLPDGAGAASTNSNSIVNLHQNAQGDTNIAIHGIGRAQIVGQTSAQTTAGTAVGATSLKLSAILPAGTYTAFCGVGTTTEQLTVANGNSTGATSAPYTATLVGSTTLAYLSTFGGLSNMVRNTTSIYNNFGLFWVNVTGLSVSGVQIGPTQAFASNCQVCTHVRYSNIEINQDRSTKNQDGWDIGPGCSDLVLDGCTGRMSDDFVSIYAQNTSGSLHPYTKSLTAAQRNVFDLTVRNCVVDASESFRIQAGDGSTAKNMLFENIVDKRLSYTTLTGTARWAICFGTTNYVTTAPNVGDISNITLRNYKGCSTYLCSTDDTYSDVTFDNCEMMAASDGTSWIALLGWANYVSGYTGTVSNIAFRNIRSHVPASAMTSGLGYVCNVGGATVSGISFTGLHLLACRAVTKNASAVAGLQIGPAHYGTLISALYGSSVAETGAAEAPTIDSFGGTGYYVGSVKTAMRLAPGHPPVSSADTYPPSPSAGSMLGSASNLLSGASAASAELCYGDGSAWNRIATLSNTSSVPGTPTGLTATAAAGQNNLSWTAGTGSVTSTQIWRGTASGAETQIATVTGAGTTYADSGSTTGTAYYYFVIPVNGIGSGGQSNEAGPCTSLASLVAFSDAFNRTASTTGANWTTAGTATFPTNGSGAGIAGTSTTTVTTYINQLTASAYTAASATNVEAQMSVSALGSSTTPAHPQVIINYTNDSNYFYGGFTPVTGSSTLGGWQLLKVVGGTATALNTPSTTTAVPTVPYTVKVQNSGGSYSLVVNGSTVLSGITDSSLTGTLVGYRIRGGGSGGSAPASETQRIASFTCGPVA